MAATFKLYSDVQHGILNLNEDGTYSYTYTGSDPYPITDSFEYYIEDLNGSSNVATEEITITEDTPSEITGATFTLYSNPASGNVTLNKDGTYEYTYTGTGPFPATDSFEYFIEDINGVSNVATEEITIQGSLKTGIRQQDQNNAFAGIQSATYISTVQVPVVVNQSFTVTQEVETVSAPGLLTGATYSTLSSIDVSNLSSNIQINSVNLDGSFEIEYIFPTLNLPDTGTFSYTITDEKGISNIATVNTLFNINVTILNNLVHNTVKVTGNIHNATNVLREYHNRQLVWDVTNETPDVLPNPDNYINLNNPLNSIESNIPVQIGKAFIKGDIPNYPKAILNSVELDTQADIKQRHPDGSVKHAIISFIVPSIAALETLKISFINVTSTLNTPLDKTEILAFDFNAKMQLDFPASNTISAKDMITSDNFSYWLSGDIVTSLIVEDRSIARAYDVGSDTNRSVKPIFHINLWPGINKFSVRYIGEISNTEVLQDQTYDLTLFIDTADTQIYSKTGLIHGGLTRWTKKFWGGTGVTELAVNHNLSYLIEANVLANYDTSRVITEDIMDGEYRRWEAADRDINELGLWQGSMGSTGTRNDIGVLNTWTLWWLYTGDIRMQEIALGQGELACAWPIHLIEGQDTRYFDENSTITGLGKVPSINSTGRPTYQSKIVKLDSTDVLPEDRIYVLNPIEVTAWKTDTSHFPNICSLEFYLTGDYYYLEEMVHSAAYVVADNNAKAITSTIGRGESPSHGACFATQVRGQAWAFNIRTHVENIAPDTHYLKDYLYEKNLNAIAYWEGIYNVNLSYPELQSMYTYGKNVIGLGSRWAISGSVPVAGFWREGVTSYAFPEMVDTTVVKQAEAPWQANYVILSLGRAAELGYKTQNLYKNLGRQITDIFGYPNSPHHMFAAYVVPTLNHDDNWVANTWDAVVSLYQSSYVDETLAYINNTNMTPAAAERYDCIAMGACAYLTGNTNGSDAWEYMLANVATKDVFNINPKYAITPVNYVATDAKTFQFAEIPELVFASGYADTEDMNLYHLDLTNLYPSGHMPWDGPSEFIPKIKCSIVGTLPTGITWNKGTGILTYDGTAVSSHEVQTMQFQNDTTGELSDTFEIKVLIPTIEWAYSDSNTPLDIAVNNVFPDPSGYNVLLVKAGEYWGGDLRTQKDGYLTCFMGRDNVYIIGEPGAMPIISGTKDDDWAVEYTNSIQAYETRVYIRCGETKHTHIKGMNLRFSQILTDGRDNAYINKVKFHTNPHGNDGWTIGYIQEEDTNITPDVFITNFETYHQGANEKNHPLYCYYTNERSDTQYGAVGSMYLNNYKAYECRGPGQTLGGHAFKSIGDVVKIRNSWFSLVEDPYAPVDLSTAGNFSLVSLHSDQKLPIVYNCDFYAYHSSLSGVGAGWALLYQNRNLAVARGMKNPSYFSYPSMALKVTNDGVMKTAFPLWEGWEGSDSIDPYWKSVKDSTYHGANANVTYSATGNLGDLEPNPDPSAIVDAPFWDTLGDISDPENPNSLPKFVSHSRFTNIRGILGETNQMTAITFRSTAPMNVAVQFASLRARLPAPPNWVERNFAFTCNNSFTGFAESQTLYETDFVEPQDDENPLTYPYAPDYVTLNKNNINNVGGDKIDGTGDQVPLPKWFKI